MIDAQDRLLDLRAQDWRRMKDSDRSKYHKQLHSMAYPKMHDAEEISTEELHKRLRNALGA